MAKKLFITFLTVLYLGVSSGATLHYQYCMGRLVRVVLWHSDTDPKCRTCGMRKEMKAAKKCCTDQHQQLKSEKSVPVTYSHISLGLSAALLPVALFPLMANSQFSLAISYPVNHAPPPQARIPVFLRNCTFRI
ncbi:hypothetical protein AAFN85_09620 [Mucilaginibacter sp. CAU 1740]|uniref:HYC_CC_PP family protein n=1 Tax=Mucilaginibacter sp. CAU 1740 TaxID=3140365 RepID=UPI00325AE33B